MVNNDVFQLYISMSDMPLMQVVQCHQQLLNQPPGLFFGKLATRHGFEVRVQALASGGNNATVQKTECANIAAAAEPLERLLLATGDKADGATLQEVNTAVEALAAMQARCGAKVAASLGPEALATLSPAAFESAKSALVTSVGGLASVSDAKGRQAAKDLACALQGLPFEVPKEEEPKADAAMTEALQASQQAE